MRFPVFPWLSGHSIVGGSLAPIIAVKLLEIYDSSVPIAVYLAAACAITLVAVLFTARRRAST